MYLTHDELVELTGRRQREVQTEAKAREEERSAKVRPIAGRTRRAGA